MDPEHGHRRRTRGAIRWSALGRLSVQLAHFGFGIVLARLLSPAEFGIIAVPAVLLGLAPSLLDSGFGAALVQRPRLFQAQSSSAFWASLALGALLAASLVLIAAPLSFYFDEPLLEPILQICAAAVIVRSLSVVPRALIRRRLDFRVVAFAEIVAAVMSGGFAVFLAIGGVGVFSLVARFVGLAVIEAIVLIIACGFLPKLHFRRRDLVPLVAFARRQASSRTISYLTRNLDRVLIAKVLGTVAAGLYVRSTNTVTRPMGSLAQVSQRVMFPSMARAQSHPELVRSEFLRVTRANVLIGLPLCLGMLVCAESFVFGALGRHWAEAVPVIRALSVASVATLFGALSSALLLARGDARLELNVTLAQRGVLLLALVLGLSFGVEGVAWSVAAAQWIGALLGIALALRAAEIRLGRFVRAVAPPTLAASAMALVVLGLSVSGVAPDLPPLGLLSAQVLLGGLVYFGLVFGLKLEAGIGLWRAMREPLAS